MTSLLILGIETSCDETATALYDSEKGLIGHKVFSQIDLHNQYGGVVPEHASRDHIKKLLPMVDHLIKESGKTINDLDAIAYTAGPGLSGALLVGSQLPAAMYPLRASESRRAWKNEGAYGYLQGLCRLG